jgi:hypothetical protein
LPAAQYFRGEFNHQVLQALTELGQRLDEIAVNFDSFDLNRGVLAAITIDSESGVMLGAVPAVLDGFAAAY